MSSNTSSKPASLPRRLGKKAGKHFLRWVGGFQSRHSLVSTTPVIPISEFPEVSQLEDAYSDIRGELDTLLERPEDIPAFHQMSPDQARISKGNSWKTFALYVYGQRVDDNCAMCPKTASALESLPGMKTAMFSILAPNYHIPAHKGPTRAMVRAQLALKVPTDSEKVWIRIHDQVLHWKEGKVMLFDDTYEHEVRNDTDETRAVLFIDIERPMDRIGTLFNSLLVKLLQGSSYIKQPLKNVAARNREHRS